MPRPYGRGRDVSSREPPPGDAHDLLDQFVVAEAGGPRGLGKARVHRGIRDDPGQRVELENVRHAEAIDADVDATPVAAAERVVGIEGGALDLGVQARGHERRALEDRERRFRTVPHPLRLVAVDGRRAWWQRREIEPDHRQTVRRRTVAEDRHREFRAREIRLDQDRLRVALEQERRALAQPGGRIAEGVAEYALTRP